MSGPIVRKYGFPNFDKIFGERPLEHGADEAEEPVEQSQQAGAAESRVQRSAPSKTSDPKKA
jgi:hypothetical protein